MKKLFTLFAIAAAAVALASCQKENFGAFDNNAAVVSIPTHEVTFTANLAKTTLSGTTPSWEDGDSVKILWVEHLSAYDTIPERDSVCSVLAKVDAATGTITASVGTPKDYFYSVYPHYASAHILLGTDGAADSLQVSIKYVTTLDGSWKSANYVAAITDPSTNAFTFKNICNVLKFTVNNADVTSVVISSNDKAYIAGNQIFQFNGEDPDNTPVIPESGVSAKTTIQVAGAGTYYVPISYGQALTAGLTFAEFDASDEMTSFTVANNSLFGERGQIWDFGTLEDHKYVPYDIYATPSGNGNLSGKDWENAIDQAGLLELLGTEMGAYKINGQNIYLSEGTFDTYYATASNGNLTMAFKKPMTFGIYGGYAATSTGKDLSLRTGTTTLTNASNPVVKSARVLYLQSSSANIIFDKIDWKPIEGSGYRGSCIYCNPGCTGSMIFNDCTLEGAKTAHYGIFAQFASMDITLNRCSFKNNQSTAYNDAGVVLCSNNNTTTFNDCEFVGNTAIANGVAIGVAAGAEVHINRCVFDNNTCNRALVSLKNAGNGRGGAVSIWYDNATYNSQTNTPAPKLYIDSCEFKNNKSTNLAGADICGYACVAGQNPELYINRSYFHDAQCSGTSTAYGNYYNAKSINIDGQGVGSNFIIGIYNTTFGPTTSPNYGNCSGVYWCNANFCFINSTIVDRGVACFRNDMRTIANEQPTTTCHLLNSVLSNNKPGNAINAKVNILPENLASGYNIMGATKNAYQFCNWDEANKKWIIVSPAVTKPNPETDGYVVYGDMNFTPDLTNGVYPFAITAGQEADADRPVQYTTAQSVADSVAKWCPNLDKWLRELHGDSAYTIDKRGNPRNPAKLQKGSWDAYLSE